jgi:hypothetical protein
VKREKPEPPMFIAETQLSLAAALHTIGDDDHLSLRQNLEKPAVDNAGDFYHGTQFFGELANETGLRGFAGFETTTGQFPLIAFVFEQRNTACFDEEALDRHGEIHPSPHAPWSLAQHWIYASLPVIVAAMQSS